MSEKGEGMLGQERLLSRTSTEYFVQSKILDGGIWAGWGREIGDWGLEVYIHSTGDGVGG
jgi:hypothetical protein